MDLETTEKGTNEFWRCNVCHTFLKWLNIRAHLQQVHPEIPLPRRLSKSIWHRTGQRKKGQVGVGHRGKVACYVCRKLFGWGYMREHFWKAHPHIILPFHLSRSRWPTMQDAADERLDQQGTTSVSGPSEVPKQQSQSVDDDGFPVMNGMSTDQTPDHEQRARDVTSRWSAMQDAALESRERQATAPISEPFEESNQQSQSLANNAFSIKDGINVNLAPDHEQRDQDGLTHGDVVAKAIPDDLLPVVVEIGSDQISEDEHRNYIDLTRWSVATHVTSDDVLSIMDQVGIDQTPEDEQEDHSHCINWDTAESVIMSGMSVDQVSDDGQRYCTKHIDEYIAEAIRGDIPQIVNEMSMDQTLYDEQGDYFGPIDWDAAAEAIIGGNVFPVMDDMGINQPLDYEQEDTSDLIDWAAEETIRGLASQSMDGISMDQAPNYGQRAYLELNDHNLAQSIPDEFFSLMDGMTTDPDPDNEQRDYIEVFYGNAADAASEDTFSAADDAQDNELYGFRLFGHKALVDLNDAEKEALARFFDRMLKEFDARELRNMQEGRL